MKRFLRSTRVRLALLAVALFAAALVVTNGAVLFVLSVYTDRETDNAILAQTVTIMKDYNDGDHWVESADIPLETSAGVPVDTVIVDANVQPIAESPHQPLDSRELALLAATVHEQGMYWGYFKDHRGIQRHLYATSLGVNTGYVLVVSHSDTDINGTLAPAAILVGALSVLLLVLGGWVAYWLSGRALSPVHTIADLARDISEHGLHRRVDVSVPDDELGELVATFNGMLARLEASFDGLRTFTAGASHELREPLAVMRSELERALARTRSSEEYREVLQWLLEDVERLGRLVDQLLVLTRIDAGTLQPVHEPVDVADFLYESAARWGRAAEAKEVKIEVEAPTSGTVSADPLLLRRAVDNLLDNAIRHTPPSSVVRLRASRTGSGLDLEVADAGPGVPPGFRSQLFTRFARPDSVRSRGGVGAGLGLALSTAIVRVHGGQLDLVETESPGATFRLRLPDAPAPV